MTHYGSLVASAHGRSVPASNGPGSRVLPTRLAPSGNLVGGAAAVVPMDFASKDKLRKAL
jgi:hypothetical protein